MALEANERRLFRLVQGARVAAGLAAAIAVLALIGWSADIPALRQLGPGPEAMNPLTAAGALLAAVSLWLACYERRQDPDDALDDAPDDARSAARSGAGVRSAARLCAVLGTAIGLVRLGAALIGAGGPDQAALPAAVVASSTGAFTSMAPLTAAAVLLAGLAMALIDARTRRGLRPAEALAIPLGLLALLRLVGYLYGSGSFYKIAAYTGMAWNSAFAFLLLAVGILCARPRDGVMRVAAAATVGGGNLRRVLPAAFLVPLALGGLIVAGERGGWYGTELAVAFIVVGSIAVFATLLWREARLLNGQDVERRHAQEELSRHQQELQEYIDGMSTMNAKVKPDGTIVLFNKIAQQGTGLSPDELRATNFLRGSWWAFDPAVVARVAAAFARACTGELVNYDERLFMFGTVLDISFSLVPVKDAAGRVGYVVAEGRDITPLKRSEQALAERTKELEAANQGLESFSYSVSHDLRAPLRAIDGFSRLLLEDHGPNLPADAQRLLDVIRTNTVRMGQLIDDLLNFSRLSRTEMNDGDVDMDQLVAGIVEDVRRAQAGAAASELVVGPLPAVRGDLALLRQVWTNLIGNALKFSRGSAHPRVEVGGRREGGDFVFFVRDNGVGFDHQYAGKLFGVFQRLHRAEQFEGTGVGLAIVKRIVERHGGHVSADGKPGEGATFSFALPITLPVLERKA